MTNVLAPLNDLVLVANVTVRNAVTGAEEAVSTGTVTGFLATSPGPAAVTADAALSVAGVYVGAQAGFTAGDWMFQLDAAVLTKTLLDTHFTTATPYFIVSRTSAVRQVIRLEYRQYMEAIVG